MLEVDAVIVGAGPAGAVTALNLAPFRRVLLLDRQPVPEPRIGESLPGAARRLLSDMGLWDGFLADGHAPCHVYRSVWGGSEPVERGTLHDPDGHGWHLDRMRFERRLRAVAVARGAQLLAPARPTWLEWNADHWQLAIEHDGKSLNARARIIVDAGGRSSRLKLGGTRRVGDRLICGWVQGTDSGLRPGITLIEAEPDGWWYAASLPQGRGVLAFHSDADLPAARAARSADGLLVRAKALPMLSEAIASGRWTDASAGFCAAHSAHLKQAAGRGWIAVGDAALAFDPLASQGLFNALYTGLAAAETIDRHLSGDEDALSDYAAELQPVRETYDAHLAAWYGVERRWADRAFWRRRHVARTTVAALPVGQANHMSCAATK